VALVGLRDELESGRDLIQRVASYRGIHLQLAGEPGGVADVIGGWFHVMVVGAGDGLVARLTERVSV
jgi:hypothetical protein